MNSNDPDELRIVRTKIEEIGKEISKNRKEIFIKHLKFPALNPTFYAAIFGLIGYFGFSIFFAQYIQNIGYQILIVSMLPFVIVLIALFWGDIPEENVANGINTIEIKQRTLTLKRHKKILKHVLNKPFHLWGKDERLLISFESLES